MILLPVESLKEGMILGKSVFSDNGELLLAAGFHIKQSIIKRLDELEIGTVWIQQEGTEEVIPEDLISEQVQRQATAAVMDAVEVIGKGLQIREETLDDIEKKMKQTDRYKNVIAVPKVQKAVSDIIDNLLSQPDIVMNLSTIRSQKSFLYRHSLDMTVLAIMIGTRLRFAREELQELGLGCILHDIGMTVLPKKIVDKPAKLTFEEYNMIKEHPTFGYTILRENPSIQPVSAHIAFQHHERQDGLGYPRQLKGNNLLPIKTLTPAKGYMHRYSEIAAVADTYDAMSSPRPYVKQRSPEEIIRHLIVAAGTQLNRAIVDVLISMIPVYPVGSFVKIVASQSNRLNDYMAVVAQVRKGHFEKPTIILIKDPSGSKVQPQKLDLMEFPDIRIQFLPLKSMTTSSG